MKRRGLLLTTTLIITLCGACSVWLRVQQQQYARNRQLIAALIHSDTEHALALINAGADPNTPQTPLPAPSLKLLLNHLLHHTPLPINYSLTALMIGCGVRCKARSGRTTHWFTLEENLPLLRAMLAHGANVQARESGNSTALHYAADEGRLHTAELLLQYGADINARDKWGRTPLMFTAQYAGTNLVHLLLEHGANPNVQDVDGNTALHWNADKPDTDRVIAELIAYGADPNLPDKYGQTPLQLAQERKRPDLVRLLTHGTKSVVGPPQNSPLHVRDAAPLSEGKQGNRL